MQKIPLIAVVDDDDFVRGSVQSLIRSLGYKAATFSSAEAFLHFASLDETDCLVTDMQMPGMSGIGLQNRLRADGRQMPVIIVTAFPEEQLRRQAQSAGATAFLTKPFDVKALISAIEGALEGAASTRGTSTITNDPY